MYLEMTAVLDSLLGDMALRSIAQAARGSLRIPLAAVSFGSSGFSAKASLFVRETLVTPTDFTACIATAASLDVYVVRQLAVVRHQSDEPAGLRSYAGCAVLDWQGNCVGVFYLMDTKPRRLTAAETVRLRCYTHLVSSRIEIVRRFGSAGHDPSPEEIIRCADQLASVGQNTEAQGLIALAYAAHDIADIHRRTPRHMAS